MTAKDLLIEVAGLVRTYLAGLPPHVLADGREFPANPVVDFPIRSSMVPLESLSEYVCRKLDLTSPKQATGLIMAAAISPASGLRLSWMRKKGGDGLYVDRFGRPHPTVAIRTDPAVSEVQS